jgi:pimeloyl-ACP methyl ester carboxylesterase
MKDLQLALRGGRTIAYTDIGAPSGPCVLFFHGAPSSRLRLAYLEPALRSDGVRVISPDRPGYGRSSPQPGRSLSDWPADVAALADAVGCERFVVAGHSSGGAYAVACAAYLQGRVSAGMLLGGVTDMGWPAAWEGYLEDEAALMRLAGEEAVKEACVRRYGADGSRFLTASNWEMPEADLQLYADEVTAQLLGKARAEAFRQGVEGYAQDMVVQGRPWPFDAAAITAPFHVLHGERDTLLPLAHSRHTAALIPGANLEVLPGHGHFSILSELSRGVAAPS